MNFYCIITLVSLVYGAVNITTFCADSTSAQADYSWLDKLLGRQREAEKKRLEAEVNKRVSKQDIEKRIREKMEDMASKNLTIEQRQEFEKQLRKAQKKAVEREREKAKADVGEEARIALRLKRQKEEEARALKTLELRRKSRKQLVRKAPFQEDEYAYLESQKEREKQKKQQQAKETTELAIFHGFERNPEYINKARKKLGKWALDDDIKAEAYKLASEAYYEDRYTREAQEQAVLDLQQKELWQKRRAAVEKGATAIKQGAETTLQSWYDSLSARVAKARERIAQKSSEKATKQWQEKEKIRAEYEKKYPQNLEEIRKSLRQTKPGWLWSSVVEPSEEQVQAVAQKRSQERFQTWEKEYPVVGPVMQKPSWRDRISNWWSSFKPMGGTGLR